MKNFYEILEISEKASPEVVEKAYKTLVKKYHPDLQTDSNIKKEYEIKIKEINEAYETISNSNLREKYDEKLKKEQIKYAQNVQAESQVQYQKHENTNSQSKTTAQYNPNSIHSYKLQSDERYEKFKEEYKQAVKKAYQDAYVKKLRDMGYRVRYKKTPKQKLQNFLIVIASIIIVILICQLPFIKNYLHNLYENNSIIKTIVDAFMNLFK